MSHSHHLLRGSVVRRAAPKRLVGDDITTRMASLNKDWKFVPETSSSKADRIRRSFSFADFEECFSFMTRVAIRAEKSQHHPEWFNVYNRLEVELSTHDCSGLSEKDFALAKYMDEHRDVLTSRP
eukprot:g834.t1